jgi:hypothetical protein
MALFVLLAWHSAGATTTTTTTEKPTPSQTP